MGRVKLATVWLQGCSGCHMSFLDLDEWLFDLADMADIVYTPLAGDRLKLQVSVLTFLPSILGCPC